MVIRHWSFSLDGRLNRDGFYPIMPSATLLEQRTVMDHPASLDDRSLLLTLEECSKLVAHSHDPHETLTNIVQLIRDRFQTAVCSVYLLEPSKQELVLGATVGLKADSVGRVRMRIEEGLTGLVAERL